MRAALVGVAVQTQQDEPSWFPDWHYNTLNNLMHIGTLNFNQRPVANGCDEQI